MAPKTQRKGGARQAMLVELSENADQTSEETPQKSSDTRAAEEQIEQVSDQEAGAVPIAVIYRTDWSSGREAYLDKVSPEVVSQEWLAAEYGGGKFRVQFKKPEGGKMVYVKQLRFEVDASLPPKPPRHARVAASGPISNADGSPATASSGMDAVLSSGILSLFQQQQENSRMQADWFRSMMEQRSKAPGIVEIMVAAAPILAIVKDLLQRPAPAPVAPGKDPIELAKELLELRGATPATEAKGAVAQLKEVLELRELLSGLGGGADAEDPMIKLVGMLGPQIIDAIKNAQTIDAERSRTTPATTSRATALPPTPAPAMRAAPGSSDATGKAASEPGAAQTQTTGEASPMDMAAMYIGQRLPKIIKLAQQQKNPDLYAQLEEDILPEPFKEAAREFVSQPHFVETIFEQHPELLEFKEWMEDFFDTFAAALLGELDEDDEEVGPLGAVAEEEVIEVEESTPGAAAVEIPPASNNGTVE